MFLNSSASSSLGRGLSESPKKYKQTHFML
jgi:hypothetical protein